MVEPTKQGMVSKYSPYNFVKTILDSSNEYCCIRKEKIQNISGWRHNIYSAPFTIACVYQFQAILYNFGIVSLPAKEDYWSSERYMPHHPIVNELGMTRDRFNFYGEIFTSALQYHPITMST